MKGWNKFERKYIKGENWLRAFSRVEKEGLNFEGYNLS